MDIKAFRPIVESLIRFVLAFTAGYAGVEVVQEQANGVIAVVATIVLASASVLWSKYSDKKVVEAVGAK